MTAAEAVTAIWHDASMAWSPLPTPDAEGPAPRSLRDSLDAVLIGLGSPPADVLTSLHGRWEELVGPAAAEHCRPLGLEAGRLVVETAEPAWASQLRWQSADLLRRAEEILGAGVVERVEIRVVTR